MIDRIFSALMLALALAYGYIAFAIIKAPFQYDPLGPESWPQILSVCAALCCLYLLFKPGDIDWDLKKHSPLVRLAVVLGLLSAYAVFYEPFGFIISTALFCAVLAILLGADYVRSGAFGLALGIGGYLVCTKLLNLNLPAGILHFI